jgi:hypothetical protein
VAVLDFHLLLLVVFEDLALDLLILLLNLGFTFERLFHSLVLLVELHCGLVALVFEDLRVFPFELLDVVGVDLVLLLLLLFELVVLVNLSHDLLLELRVQLRLLDLERLPFLPQLLFIPVLLFLLLFTVAVKLLLAVLGDADHLLLDAFNLIHLLLDGKIEL